MTLHSTSETSAVESPQLELSVVIPCLNEADTLGICIEKARRAMDEHGIKGEIVVSDNGSEDGSQQIAIDGGARVVHAPERGYGAALIHGIGEARGKYVIMGDADDSYDFLEIPKFVNELRKGYDLVQGCRLPWGGGTVKPGAMPFLHRWLGNPMFTFLVRRWFNAPIHDVYCGLRGFTKAHYETLNQSAKGMEFATEMIIKSSLNKARIAEVPITLHPDGRVAHAPHLRTFRDGWHTLRFFLMFSPRSLFLVPGIALMVLGIACALLVYTRTTFGPVQFDAHTLLFGSMFLTCGYQAILFAMLTKTFAIRQGLHPPDTRHEGLFETFSLDRSLVASVVMLLVGGGMLLAAFLGWQRQGYGNLDYSSTMRLVIPGATLTVLGMQTLFSAFSINIVAMSGRGSK